MDNKEIRNRVEAVLAGNRIPVRVNVERILDGATVFVPKQVPDALQGQISLATGASKVDILTHNDKSMIVLKGV